MNCRGLIGKNVTRKEVNSYDRSKSTTTRENRERGLKAFADISINESLLIKGLRVVSGAHGEFVSMPQEKSSDGKWYDTVRCMNNNVKEQISDIVLYAYQNT